MQTLGGPRKLPVLLVGSLLLAPSLQAGCGQEQMPAGPSPATPPVPETSLAAELAMAGRAGSLDPLFASTRAGRLISRQIHEPLVTSVSAPFGSALSREGPGRLLPPTGRSTKWRVRLRPAARFQDGVPIDAAAVRANFTRWVSSGLAERALPGVVAVDSPRPGIVRFQFSGPTPDFPALISNPRLGLVSPDAIAEAAGRQVRGIRTGAGPFELRERRGDRVVLGRNAQWWGDSAGLGPGVGRLTVGLGAGPRERVERLRSGVAQIADSLTAAGIREVRRDPLLSTAGRDGEVIGVERSVRGIESLGGRQSLSELWLTDLP